MRAQINKIINEKGEVTADTTEIQRVITDFSLEIMQAITEWSGIFKVLKEKNHQPRILYPAKLFFRVKDV